MPGPVDPLPGDRAARSPALLVPAVCGLVAVLCAVLLSIAPVEVSRPTVSWPREPGRPEPTLLALTGYRPLALDVRFGCSAARLAARTPMAWVRRLRCRDPRGRAVPDRRPVRRGPRPDRGLRLLRRRAAAGRCGGRVPQPAAPPRAPAGRRAETFWSGLGAVRRDAFLTAERFPHASVEDIDLGVRLVAAGARIELDPLVQGTHLKAWTLAGMVRTDFARRGVPWVALLLRAGHSSTALNLGWRNRLSAAACALGAAAALAGRPRPALGALLVLLGLNRDFYRLLARRRGWPEAVLGIGLHALHHLTAVAAVPVGVARHLRDRPAEQRRRERTDRECR